MFSSDTTGPERGCRKNVEMLKKKKKEKKNTEQMKQSGIINGENGKAVTLLLY